MHITVNTEMFKNILGTVRRGTGSGKVLPITEYVELLFTDGTLYATTCDLTTWVTYNTPIEDISRDVTLVVHCDRLYKLVSKTTVPEIKLHVGDGVLDVEGNGRYSIPIIEEEFPGYDMKCISSHSIDVTKLKSALDVNKSSIATDDIVPCLMGYYLADKVVTTDSIKMTICDTPIIDEGAVLMSERMAGLVQLLDNGEGTMEIGEGGTLYIGTDNISIFGSMVEGIEYYPNVSTITQSAEFTNCATVGVKELKSAISRMGIFNDPLTVNVLEVRFSKDTIVMSCTGGIEEITCENQCGQDSTVKVNLDLLRQVLTGVREKEVYVHYGNPSMLKLECGNVEHYLCLIRS